MRNLNAAVEPVQRALSTAILHRIVRFNNVAYLAGVVADDLSAGVEGQTRDICRKLDELLAEAGSSAEELLSAQIFLTDMSRKAEMDRAWQGWIDARDLPARATIGVTDLGDPRILVEIVVTAAA